jgi:integrase/recombinase XerD
MAQASVLSDNDIRRVFRIIETTRHADRNRLAFVLSIYAGMRVGEIAALTIGDVVNQHGEARPEIKLGAHQTKGMKGRTVVLSTRIGREIGAYLKSQPERPLGSPLICSQRNRRAFSSLTLSMLFKEIYEIAGIRTSSHSGRRTFATRRASGCGQFRSLWDTSILALRHCIAMYRKIYCAMRWRWFDRLVPFGTRRCPITPRAKVPSELRPVRNEFVQYQLGS